MLGLGARSDASEGDEEPVPVGPRRIDYQLASILVPEDRPRLPAPRVVGDLDDVDLTAQAVRFADLPDEEMAGDRVVQSTTSTETDLPSP